MGPWSSPCGTMPIPGAAARRRPSSYSSRGDARLKLRSSMISTDRPSPSGGEWASPRFQLANSSRHSDRRGDCRRRNLRTIRRRHGSIDARAARAGTDRGDALNGRTLIADLTPCGDPETAGNPCSLDEFLPGEPSLGPRATPRANACTGVNRSRFVSIYHAHHPAKPPKPPFRWLSVLSVPSARIGILRHPRIAGVVRPVSRHKRISSTAPLRPEAGCGESNSCRPRAI